MSRHDCKSTWLASGCPRHPQSLKSRAPHIGIETGKETPRRTETGHTAPTRIITAGTHQTGHGRLTGGLAVMGIEKGKGHNLGKRIPAKNLIHVRTLCIISEHLFCQLCTLYVCILKDHAHCRTGSHSHEHRKDRERQYEGSRAHGGRR